MASKPLLSAVPAPPDAATGAAGAGGGEDAADFAGLRAVPWRFLLGGLFAAAGSLLVLSRRL